MAALTVLSVAYPLAPVGPDAVGGAEQVLCRLDAALVEAGHRSVVVACGGSSVRGALVATPPAPGVLDDAAKATRTPSTGARSRPPWSGSRSTWSTCTGSTSTPTCHRPGRRLW
jgi:hypothetical protein